MRTIANTLLSVLACLAIAGCVYRGCKVIEGTDLAVGFTVPGTDGAIQFDALNYLSGFRLGVAENSGLKVKYTVAETNDYLWGAVMTRVWKTIDAKVEPCEVAPQPATMIAVPAATTNACPDCVTK